MKIKQLMSIIDTCAIRDNENWDNVGLLIGNRI